MTKHLADYFDGDSGAEGNGSGEGVSADMGCEVLVDTCVLVDAFQESSVVREAYLGEFPVVALQDVNDGRQQHHVVLCAGLDTGGAWDDECAIMFFGLGEIGSHQVGVAEAGIALHDEEVQCFLVGRGGWCP